MTMKSLELIAIDKLKYSLLEIAENASKPSITEKLKYVLSGESGNCWGSQSRGKIFLFCAGIDEYSVRIASAIELWHNVSLMIDDVIDNSTERRGNRSFWNKYSKDEVHTLSFYMDKIATQILIDIGYTNILAILNKCAIGMAEIETDDRFSIKTADDYFKLVTKKTANFYKVACYSAAEYRKQEYNSEFVEIVKECGISHQIFDDWKDQNSFQQKSVEFLNERRTNWCFLPELEASKVRVWHEGNILGLHEQFNRVVPKVPHEKELRALLSEIQGSVITQKYNIETSLASAAI